MDLHYSQTCFFLLWWLGLFHYLMDLHYSQTPGSICSPTCRFHYLMDLHYSQTVVCSGSKVQKFHYLMDLHYSQTDDDTYTGQIAFHYLMDLHYSQTINSYTSKCMCFTTLWIYTILKPAVFASRTGTVSLPYGFTLFSNKVGQWLDTLNVSLPYGFTLFSNPQVQSTAWLLVSLPYGFTLFSNYTVTVPIGTRVSLPYGFTLFSNQNRRKFWLQKFHYLMDLHYSQTIRLTASANSCFTTLWIYTILKPQISCAHYTAQGKSTRSSTIVLWRNGIVKGTQIPIQHIEFGAHIYARRCLAL